MLAHHIISSGRLLARNDLGRVLRGLPGELDFETRTLFWSILGGSGLAAMVS
jgi:hypothetical protein